MDIAWYGHAAFRLRGRDAAVVLDPCPSSTGFRLGRPTAEIVTISNPAPEHAWHAGVGGEPMCLDAPGEYEIHNLLIAAVATNPPPAARVAPATTAGLDDEPSGDLPDDDPDDSLDDVTGDDPASMPAASATQPPADDSTLGYHNVAFVITIDDLVVAHLGDLRREPCKEALEELSRADILLVPVGGNGGLDAKTAVKVVRSIDPRLVIPMHYKVGPETATLDGVDAFLSAMGADSPAELDNHLNVTAATLGEHTVVHVLSPRGD